MCFLKKNSCAHLQNHPSLPASGSGPSAGAPRAAPCRSSTRWAWARETCAGCCCTSQLCFDCRTGAVKQKQQEQIKFIQCANEQQSHTCRYKGRDLTYKSVEHLVEDRSQTPPVNCAVVRLLLENLWGQVLHGKRRGRVNTRQTIITGGVCALNLEICCVPQVSHRRLLLYRWPQHLLCRGQSLWGQCGPVSLTGCSRASGPCDGKKQKEAFRKMPPALLQFSSALIMLTESTRRHCRSSHYLYTMCREWR